MTYSNIKLSKVGGNTIMNTFGEQLKGLRKEKGLTQKQLADALKLDQSTISYWEQNKKLPDLRTFDKLASFFQVSMDRFKIAVAGSLTEEEKLLQDTVSSQPTITVEDLKNKFDLIVDGRPATKEEIEEAMLYIAIQRKMKEK